MAIAEALAMGIIDAIIIYLACGSPFAVYQMTKPGPTGRASAWLNAAASLIAWPLLLVVLSVKHYSSRHRSNNFNEVDRLRLQIEQIAFSDREASSVFEFREVYNRYAGLAEAYFDQRSGSDIAAEVVAISGRMDTSIASQCLVRRNKSKLQYHLSAARNDLVELISTLGPIRARAEIKDLAIELARYFDDEAASADLSSLIPSSGPPAVPTPNEAEVWKAKRQKVSGLR